MGKSILIPPKITLFIEHLTIDSVILRTYNRMQMTPRPCTSTLGKITPQGYPPNPGFNF